MQLASEIDSLVEATMEQWHTPGLVLMIIQDGAIAHAKGYGYRNVCTKEVVDPETMFVAASTTKAFTATALGILADEGILSWETPIHEYLPDLHLSDYFVQQHVTVVDLLSHRTGYPRHDKVWYGAKKDRAEVLKALRYIEPNCGFRSKWQYNNLMYVLAGRIVEVLAGMSWEDFVAERILTPLNMERSTFITAEAKTMFNHAAGYVWRDGKYLETAIRDVQNISPAGSLHTCGRDMAKWIQFQLMHSNSDQIIQRETLAKIHAPVICAPSFLPGRYAEIQHTEYGLGWFSEIYRGYKTVYHVGNLDGFYALVSFMPDVGIGQVILTNMTPNKAPYVLSYSIYDRLLHLSRVDWNHKIAEKTAELELSDKEMIAAKKKEKVLNTTPSFNQSAFCGVYDHPAYGKVTVSEVKGKLQLTYSEFTAHLKHIHYDVFLCEGPENGFPGYMTATFLSNGCGRVDELVIPLEPSSDPIRFKRFSENA